MSFVKNSLTLLSGNVLALVFSFLTMPILTRLYTPDAFGLMSIFTSVYAIGETFSSLRYTHAILLPKDDKDAVNVFYLSIMLVIIFSLLSLAVIYFLRDSLLNLLNVQAIGNWILFIPLSVLLGGEYLVAYVWSIRRKEFKAVSISRVVQVFTLIVSQIIFSYYLINEKGLIAGFIISQFFTTIFLARNIIVKDSQILKNLSIREMKYYASRYIRFPQFSLPGDLISSLSSQMPALIMTRYFGSATAGYFSLTNRVLVAPITVIGNSIMDVFKEKAATEFNAKGNCEDIYKKTAKYLALISFGVFSILFLIAPKLFTIVFGSNWKLSGLYAQYLIPLFIFKFIASPLSYLLYIFEKQNLDLIWQIFLLIVVTASLYVGVLYGSSNISLIAYSFSCMFMYIIYIALTYKISKGI